MDRPEDHIGLNPDDIDLLNPFFLRVGLEGRVMAHGRTIPRVYGVDDLVGREVSDLFIFVRPRNVTPDQLVAGLPSLKIRTRISEGELSTTFNGSSVPFYGPDGSAEGAILMLSPGIEVQRLVDLFALKQKDLPAADSSADLLFLVQTQKQMLLDAIANAERLERARHQAEEMASTDSMTGLMNRRGLTQRFEKIMASKSGCGVLHVDLDRFKPINDTYGHTAGDAVILGVARILEDVCPAPSFAARIGGDEFVVVAPGADTLALLKSIARDIHAEISRPIDWNGVPVQVGATCGLAMAEPGQQTTLDEILHMSDLALFEGKRSDRGSLCIFDPALMHYHQRLREDALEVPAALERGEFVPYYHPQIDVVTGSIVGVEVLARWQHPDRGLLAPGAFMQAVEYANLLDTVDSHVRRSALSAYAGWRRSGIEIPGVSFNLSVDALRDPEIGQELAWQATELGVPLDCVTLEVLESVFIDGASDDLALRAEALSDQGFRLSLDDFGTGHASLSALIALPVGEIKIDRSFIHGVSRSVQLRTLAETLCRMGQNLGLDVVAEGVERPEDLQVMREFGVATVQGFLFARPMTGDALLKMARMRVPARRCVPARIGVRE